MSLFHLGLLQGIKTFILLLELLSLSSGIRCSKYFPFLLDILYLFEGKLFQVNTTETICFSNIAVFTCIHENQNYHVWTLHNDDLGLSFSGYFNLFSAIYINRILGPSQLIMERKFVNQSSITSTLTILGATYLNGTVVGCGEDTMTFYYNPENPGKSRLCAGIWFNNSHRIHYSKLNFMCGSLINPPKL